MNNHSETNLLQSDYQALMTARETACKDEVCKEVPWLHAQKINLICVLVLHGIPGHGVPCVKGATKVFWEACLGEGAPRRRQDIIEVTDLLIAETDGSEEGSAFVCA